MTAEDRLLIASDIGLAIFAGLFLFCAIVLLWRVWEEVSLPTRENRLWGGFMFLFAAVVMIVARWVVWGHWGF